VVRFALLIDRRGRVPGRTCGPRRLRRPSQACLVATQGDMAVVGPRRDAGDLRDLLEVCAAVLAAAAGASNLVLVAIAWTVAALVTIAARSA
jgi:hypothetical protein